MLLTISLNAEAPKRVIGHGLSGGGLWFCGLRLGISLLGLARRI